jgi:Dolichyl-phosphate-mannose-protein mannosyltransferase
MPKHQPIPRRELKLVVGMWLGLAVATLFLAGQNLSIPGLYYDEAIFAGMAKDFVTGHVHGPHLRGSEIVNLFGRPFPMFIQSYLGALKSWMLIPAFQLFGANMAVLRLTTLFWGLAGLFFFMLATWRWLGLRAAIFAGPLLAFDPAYFFLSVLDWGAAVSSFFCRFVAFYLIVIWSRQRRNRYLFLAAVFAGLGFFNKVDFVVLLAGVILAAAAVYARRLPSWRDALSVIALSLSGFALGAGAMLFKAFGILTSGMPASTTGPGELIEKLRTLVAMFDGSYFSRLMNCGGVFQKMYDSASQTYSLFGFAFLIAAIALLVLALRTRVDQNKKRISILLLVATALITIGMIVLPGAVRIHHTVMVFPLPHLVVATAASFFWDKIARARKFIVIAAIVVVASNLAAISSTQKAIRSSGGSGRWSEGINTFCREFKDRADLRIVSLDWGFNEQLAFLTDSPELAEPFWPFLRTAPALPAEPRYIYLVHPPDLSVSQFGLGCLREAQEAGPLAEVRPYFDRQNRVAFYSIRFKEQ